MEITPNLTDEAVLKELGTRLERTRLERNLTQRELAEEAGVERKAVQRLEAGESVRLTSFLRVLRALELLESLDQLLPEPVPSPIELLRLHGRERRRASGSRRGRRPRTGGGGQSPPAGATRQDQGSVGWSWGDETANGRA
jgi:putative transcriptional regulator